MAENESSKRGSRKDAPAPEEPRQDGPREEAPKAVRRRRLSPASRAWLAVAATMVLVAGLGSQGIWPPGTWPRGTWRGETGTGAPLLAFDLQGHRGARGLAPENSLPGLEAALAIGVTTLELDLGLTADGELVVHHDRRLDPERTRRAGRWLYREETPPALTGLTLADLQRYGVGRVRPDSAVAARFPDRAGEDGVTIPSLRTYLALAEALSGGRMRYNLETKLVPDDPESSADPRDFAEILVAVLGELGVSARSTVQSLDWRSLQAVQVLAPEIATAYLTAEQPWLDNLRRGRPGVSPWTAGFDIDDHEGSAAALIDHLGGAIWSPCYRDLREADLREAKRLGLRVVVWTVNDPGDMSSLIDLGVDGIITDYPDRLRAVMETKGLPLPARFPESLEAGS